MTGSVYHGEYNGKERPGDAAMKPMPAFTWGTLFNLILVAGCATGVRIWYVAECCGQGKRAGAARPGGAADANESPSIRPAQRNRAIGRQHGQRRLVC